MDTQLTNFKKKNLRFIGIMSIAALLLLVPLIAMIFTHEVIWTFADFIVAGILLFGTGMMCEFVIRKVKRSYHRIIICGIILLSLILVWVELAVGIF